jgi:D-alanyl-D-alanine carboxypeptidase
LLYGYLTDEQPAFDRKAAAEIQQTNEEPKIRAIDRNAPELILVNKAVRLDRDYEPADLVPIRGIYLRETAALALNKMLKAAEQAGISDIRAISGYRSYATQEVVYANKIARLRPEYGEAAETEALKLVAPPGGSEHQSGLAVDLSIDSFLEREYVLNYDFANTMAGSWLRENAWQYGFILRYGEAKEAKTSFSYEPWHFRYAGKENAKVMYEEDLCLEEYLAEK